MASSSERWYTVIGSWGDALCCLGNIRACTDAAQILHYGFDPEIAPFLLRQRGVAAVRAVRPESDTAYRAVQEKIARPGNQPADWPEVYVPAGLGPGDLLCTHLSSERMEEPTLPRVYNLLSAPYAVRRQAERQVGQARRRGGQPVVLLHPYSMNSVAAWLHWPHWAEAIAWLLAETPYTYLLTGQDWQADLKAHPDAARWPFLSEGHPRLVNLLDTLPSMPHLFALAEACDGVITTSNSLALWSTCQHLDGLILCNGLTSYPGNYFRRWFDVPSQRVLEWTAPLEAFVACMRGWSVGRSAGGGRQ